MTRLTPRGRPNHDWHRTAAASPAERQGPRDPRERLLAAEDREYYAHHGVNISGAVRAAAWLCGRDAGLYDMQDVLGFRQA